MRPHGRDRVPEAGAVLDGQPLDGVGVVAAPDLREIAQHAGVKPAAAAGAPLKQHLGETLRQRLQQAVDAQHTAVGGFALALGRQRAAVHVAEVAVHIPLDVGDVVVLQKVGHPAQDKIDDFGPGQVQRQLAAAGGGAAAGQRQRPVGVGAVEVGILADHLGLDPDAEPHAQRVHAVDQRVQPAGQLGGVDLPVAQAAVVVVALAEPAVVQHHQLHAQRGGFFGNGGDLVGREVKVGGFPVVDQHRPPGVAPGAAADIPPQKTVVQPRQRAQARAGVRQDDLGRGKGLPRLQQPAKAFVLDAGDDAHQAGLRLLDIGAETAGVRQHDAAAVAGLLGGVVVAQDDEGVVVVAGRPPG